MRRALGSTLIAMLLAVAMAGSAGAAVTAAASDPDDTQGRLDIRFLRFQRDHGSVTLTLRTAEKWRCRLLEDDTSTAAGAAEAYEDGKVAFLLWAFDSNRDDNDDHHGYFRCKEGRLRFEFDRADLSYKARRPDLRTVKVTVPVGRFGLDHQGLRVHAISQLNGRFGNQTLFEERDDTRRLRPYRS